MQAQNQKRIQKNNRTVVAISKNMCYTIYNIRLPIERQGYSNGKEGCVRETQEGCPLLLKSVVFETFSKFQKLRQRAEKAFWARWI